MALRQNYKSQVLRLKSMLTLRPQKLPPPQKLEASLKKYSAHIELLKTKRKEVKDAFIEKGNPNGLITLDLTFMASKLGGGSFADLAKTLDNSGELEPFADLLPGYAAYRRVLLLMPKGVFFKGVNEVKKPGGGIEIKDTTSEREKVRQHQAAIGSKMMVTICLIDMERENQNQLSGYIKAMAKENFGQIFPNFE